MVPARNRPTTTIGASIRSSDTSGWRFIQSTTRSRLVRQAKMAPGTTIAPTALSCASDEADSQ
ncbi:MAG: hypothetical protein WDN69_28540 [Aliidongia sp.]